MIKEKLELFGIKCRDIKKKKNVYCLDVVTYDFYKFYNFIYGNSSYYLDRKKSKFRDMLDNREDEFNISDVSRVFRYSY